MLKKPGNIYCVVTGRNMDRNHIWGKVCSFKYFIFLIYIILLFRELKDKIQNLKESEHTEKSECSTQDECSETESEGHGNISNDRPNACSSPEPQTPNSLRSERLADLDEVNDDVPLISFLQPGKRLFKRKQVSGKQDVDTDQTKKDFSIVVDSQQTVVGRKRVRVILSDDESETEYELGCPKDSSHKVLRQNEEVSDESMYFDGAVNYTDNRAIQDNVEEGSCSYTPLHPVKVAPNVSNCRSLSNNIAVETTGCSKRGSRCDAGDSNGTHCKTGAALVNFHAYSKTEDVSNRDLVFELSLTILDWIGFHLFFYFVHSSS